jgi:hypothetical protein
MRHFLVAPISGLVLAGSLAGCSDFLEGDDLSNDPNAPSEATVSQLFVGAQSLQIIMNEGTLARISCIIVQQCGGTSRQHQSYGLYVIAEDAADPEFSSIYVSGGLVDHRAIQTRSIEVGDSGFAGVGMVMEALNMGNAAGLWGDLPYSQALSGNPTPPLDDQLAIYAGVQAKLDTAVLYLAATGPTNVGPGIADLVYGGDLTKWLRAAYTLKARYHLHLAELEGTPRYTAAIAAATNGINDPTGAGDYTTYHGTGEPESNIWYQFTRIQRAGDIAPGGTLVELMRARGDARLATYFAPVPPADATGAPCPLASDPLPYGGADPGGSFDPCTVSDFAGTRVAPDFRQPLITYDENELILAESYARLGDDGNAQLHLNNVRVAKGGLAPTAATGPTLLQEIGQEQYIVLFQNVEAWATWKRTCTPVLVPAGGAAEVYPRLLYGNTERNANPNIPPPGVEPNAGRNDNDPNPCPTA